MKRSIRSVRITIQNFRILIRLCLILLICYFCYFFAKLPQWHIDQSLLKAVSPEVIKIEDNKITPTYKIVDIVRQTNIVDHSIYRLDTNELKKNILSLEPVEKVYIRRYWLPARIHIAIVERKPVIALTPAPDVAPSGVITSDGKYIGRAYLPLSGKYKMITVLSNSLKGDEYKNWDQKRVKTLETIVNTLETLSNQKVVFVDLRTPKDVYIKLDNVMVRLGELNDTVLDRAANIASILPQIKDLDKKIKYIDLRWDATQSIKLDETTPQKPSEADELPAPLPQ